MLPILFICPFFFFSNKMFRQGFLKKKMLHLGFWNFVLTLGKTSCVMNHASACLSFPVFVIFSFSPIKVLITEYPAPKKVSLKILDTSTEGCSIWCNRKYLYGFFLLCSFFPSLTPVSYIGKFVSILSQKLLHLGVWNLVQNFGMNTCIL